MLQGNIIQFAGNFSAWVIEEIFSAFQAVHAMGGAHRYDVPGLQPGDGSGYRTK
jgi:hypothetical protein